jgi:proton-dependent oligopeptide transporter, POT family
MSSAQPQRETLFGHPAGLYTLFFAEMWERFSYYGMRALLVFYMTKGFLGYEDSEAFTVYGAYTALVYMTPFFGGILADKLLGKRRAVILGGTLMALGHLMMTVEHTWGFFAALALLIAGNGFFKPNISTIVGSLYPHHSGKRDAGFTIFYMGINLGAAMSPLLCGYIGETYGWHYGFGLATIGMISGLAVFVMPGVFARLMIMAGAVSAAVGLFVFHPDNPAYICVNVFVGLSVLSAAVVSWVAIGRGGLPEGAGAPPEPNRSGNRLVGPAAAQYLAYLGTLLAIPVFALLVSGFAPLRKDRTAYMVVSEATVKSLKASTSPVVRVFGEVAKESSKPAGLVLGLAGLIAAAYLAIEAFRLDRIARERMYVIFVLFFFVMLFWAFFEQAGSSVNLFTDRNVDRVIESGNARRITDRDVGETIFLEPTQEQLGYSNGDQLFTMDVLDRLRKNDKVADPAAPPATKGEPNRPELKIAWLVAPDNVGMRVARGVDEIPASVFQSVNAIFILLFGPLFTLIWTYLGTRGLEPSTPLKFALGLLQLGLGFVAFWYGAKMADDRGVVQLGWLLLGYLLHTTGELCLSPVGLSMVTKLSPRHLVSTVMGTWMLSNAFSQLLAGIIAQFTQVVPVSGKKGILPPPIETVHTYGDVFGPIAIAALVSSVICLALVPLLKRWMHEEIED